MKISTFPAVTVLVITAWLSIPAINSMTSTATPAHTLGVNESTAICEQTYSITSLIITAREHGHSKQDMLKDTIKYLDFSPVYLNVLADMADQIYAIPFENLMSTTYLKAHKEEHLNGCIDQIM